jgi:hypothetical protein
MMNSQSGQALPLAILALAIGSLVVAPFLGLAGSDLIGSRVYGEAIARQSACDAGIEHAIWSLTKGSLAEQLGQPGDEVTYQLDETLNGMVVSITVTANATGGGSFEGDITDAIIDTLEFDTSNGFEPSILNVTGNIYAIAYRGTSNDGFLKTILINAEGEIGNSAIDTLEFDTADGYEPRIIYVSGNVYAIAYRGPSNDGFIKTISIAANGDIGNSVIDTLEFDTSNGYEPSIIYVSGNVYAIAYRGPDNDGFLKTVSIAANGDIGNSVIDTLEYDTANGYEPCIIYISGNVYAIAYRGTNADGFLKTVSIAANGDIGNSVIDTLEYDIANGYEPSITNVSGNVYAIAYRGTSTRGYLKTVTIASNGDIGNSVIDTLIFDTILCYKPRIIHISNDIYAIAYRGPSNRGNLKIIAIAAGGDIANSVTDTMQFDASSGYEPVITNTSGDIYAIAYRGQSSDGFVKTVEIAGTGGPASYEIAAAAGDRTIRALVNIDNDTVTVISWRIE